MSFKTASSEVVRRRALLKAALGAAASVSFPHLSRGSSLIKPVIVIDPGHGGRDYGAIGEHGSIEKEVSLDVALKLRNELKRNTEYKVILTRDEDVFVSLMDRVKLAQTNRAHLLISLHADALHDRSIHGACVYRLAPSASDALTAELATSHNGEISTGTRGAPEHPPGISVIMETLMFREKQSFSQEIQSAMVEALESRVRLLNNPVRHGHFLVLRSGRIPSLLLEMGFLSNPRDEQLIVSEDYQQALIVSAQEAIDRCVHRFAAAASSG